MYPAKTLHIFPGSHTHSSFITPQRLSNASPSPLPLSTSTENFRRNLRSFTTNSAPLDYSQTSSESLHTYSASSSRPHSRSPSPCSHSPLSLQAHAYGHQMLMLQAHRDEACAHVQLLAHHLIWLTQILLELPQPPEWQVLRTVVGNLTPTTSSQEEVDARRYATSHASCMATGPKSRRATALHPPSPASSVQRVGSTTTTVILYFSFVSLNSNSYT